MKIFTDSHSYMCSLDEQSPMDIYLSFSEVTIMFCLFQFMIELLTRTNC